MGLNENVTYNIMKEKGLYRDTLGVHKGKNSEALSHEAPNRKRKRNTQSATADSKNKNKKQLQCSILKPESASWKFVKQLCKLLQLFLLFKCSRSWNPTHCYCLKRVILFQFYKQPHPPEPQLVKVLTSGLCEQFSLQWSSSFPNSWVHRHVPPLRQPRRSWIPTFSALFKTMRIKYIH